MNKFRCLLFFLLIFPLVAMAQEKAVSKIILQGEDIAPDLSIFPAGFIPGRLTPSSLSPSLLIADTGNMAFLVLDQEMKIIHKIKCDNSPEINSLLLTGASIKINVFKDIIGLIPNGPLLCLDSQGQVKFRIPEESIKNQLINDEFWLYRDGIVYNTGQPGIIDSQGTILSGRALEEKKWEYLSQSSHMQDEKIRKPLLAFLKNQGALLCGDFYFPPYPSQPGNEGFYNYLEWLTSVYETEHGFKLKNYKDRLIFLNYDLAGNIYFRLIDSFFQNLGERVVVFNKYGKLLEEFQARGQISSWGNQYSLEFQGDAKAYTMTSYANTWAPLDKDFQKQWLTAQLSKITELIPYEAPVSIKSISSSSALADPGNENTYHAVKVFDGNSQSMWIEADKNFGRNHWVEIEFHEPVTIDRIEFQPGSFWEKYWDQNNRIRQMKILLDEEMITANFQDVMKTQGISFTKEKSITKARFIINQVYKSSAWNDTAISEIRFLYKDEPLFLDIVSYSHPQEETELKSRPLQ